jgi:hypothetical protein
VSGGDGSTRGLDEETLRFYLRALEVLDRSGTPYMIGGAYALAQYTDIVRHTKDLDVFLRRTDVDRALEALAAAGFETERSFPHWLAKAKDGADRYVDLIYASGNGVALVDEEWFAHAEQGQTLGRPILLIPPEEMIWSKSWVQERERYDGADVIHLLRARGDRLDWHRLLRRFGGERWRVLFSYLVLFGFVYPGRRGQIPEWVMRDLVERLEEEFQVQPVNGDDRLCRGTLLSREQYMIDVEAWAHEDARKRPDVGMSDEDIKIWTDAIQEKKAS